MVNVYVSPQTGSCPETQNYNVEQIKIKSKDVPITDVLQLQYMSLIITSYSYITITYALIIHNTVVLTGSIYIAELSEHIFT